jgi:phosphatidylinositol alpha-1,6-mannosyltransferase
MRFAFFTYGLSADNTRLMPWRYVLEIARGTANAGNEVIVVSDGAEDSGVYPESFPPIFQVAGPFLQNNSNYRALISDFRPDAVFFPVARRSVLSGKLVKVNGAAHFAYFPGGWYQTRNLLNICWRLPAVDALYYGLESAVPGAWLIGFLRRNNIDGVLSLSEYTGRMISRNGWPNQKLKVLSPGLDVQYSEQQPSRIFRQYSNRLLGKKYLLFMGQPRLIRGIGTLLKAFDMAAPKIVNVSIVCLIRGGTKQELSATYRTLDSLQHRSRVITISGELNRADIEAFIAGCHAVVLPFILVPSEIPLTILEVLALGKPILISETGGSSEYVGDAGMIFPACDKKGVENALIKACKDEGFYSKICRAAKDKSKRQPSWQKVVEDFLGFVMPIVSDRKAFLDIP